MGDGSFLEDQTLKDEGDIRVFNHFYDPLTGLGLSNLPGDKHYTENDQITPVGRDSFTWASERNCVGIEFYVAGIGVNEDNYNRWSWQNARDLQWQGLTGETRDDRRYGFTNMFLALGHVVHLLQDTSQPQHVRNEQHVPLLLWKSPIEKYGFENIENLNFQPRMLSWRTAGFTKLKDFWDREIYKGGPEALITDAHGGAKLGLAEFSNGNFVGERHSYHEVMAERGIKPSGGYYPYPSRKSGTTYDQVKINPNLSASTLTMRNGETRTGPFLKKVGEGIEVSHHSRINYLAMKGIGGTEKRAFCTVNDEKVLEEYHSILIPKAVEYSAGVIDYFFRGQLETTMVPNTSGGYDLTIKNVSGQDFHGGEFRLYWDNASIGNRTRLLNPGNSTDGNFVMSWSGTLEDGHTASATFKPPTGAVRSYTLVYKGTIGAASGSDQHDPVDNGIAIAAKTFYPFLYWTMDNVDPTSGDRIDSSQGVHLVPGTINGGVISSVAGKISNAAELYAPDNLLSSSGSTLSTALSSIPYTGNGVTLTGWLRASEPTVGATYRLYLTVAETTLPGPLGLFGAFDGYNALYVQGSAETPISYSADVWHFFVLEFNEAAGEISIQFDGGSATSLASTPPLTNFHFVVECTGTSSTFTLALDEVGLFPFVLTSAQKEFLYNYGAGRSYPFTLP